MTTETTTDFEAMVDRALPPPKSYDGTAPWLLDQDRRTAARILTGAGVPELIAERDAAVRAQEIAERDYALMKERAQVWRKEADMHLTAQEEQVAKRRAVEAERDALKSREEVAVPLAKFREALLAKVIAERDALKAEVERLKAEREWHPMESAPRDGSRFLVLPEDFYDGGPQTVSFEKDGGFVGPLHDNTWLRPEAFIGWMPLPPLPTY